MDWKVIAALVVAVAIVVSGFIASGGVTTFPAGTNPLSDFVSGIKNMISNILAADKNINRTLQVSGSLKMENNILSLNIPANSIILQLNAPSQIILGSERVNLSAGATVSVDKFFGKIDIHQNGTVLVDGNAETSYVNGIGILSQTQKNIPIKTISSAEIVKIYNASVDKLYFNVSGFLNVGGEKVMLKLDNEPLTIENFFGAIEVSGSSLSVNGFSTRVMLSKKEKVMIG